MEQQSSKKPFYRNNFYLRDEEKDLYFKLKRLHKLNNKLGNVKESYQSFILEMNAYYDRILEDLEKEQNFSDSV